MPHDDSETIRLLRQAAEGSVEARDRVWDRLYDDVLEVARVQRQRWTGDWTLETRVLAHEVFIKVWGDQAPKLNDRGHFYALLARAIRQILVNYSQQRRTAKRGGGAVHVSMDAPAALELPTEFSQQILDLHDALGRFETMDERASQVVELRFFAGLNYDEIAESLDISRATAVRDWNAARAWLHAELSESGSPTLPPLEEGRP